MAELSSKSGPWFAISMGLIGVIVGYGLATGIGSTGDGGSAKPPQVAQQPTAPTPTPTPTPPPAGDVKPVDPKTDFIRGNAKAQVSIIEYSDFECPFCKRHAPTMKQILDEYDDVNVIFRHFPLSFHQNAQKAAEASECAADQGGNDKFWEYHDLLFEKGVGADKYAGYAEELGLNVGDFTSCLDSGKFEQKVKDDFASGAAAGVRGTPGNIIIDNKTEESRVISGALPFDSFKTVIDEMLGS